MSWAHCRAISWLLCKESGKFSVEMINLYNGEVLAIHCHTLPRRQVGLYWTIFLYHKITNHNKSMVLERKLGVLGTIWYTSWSYKEGERGEIGEWCVFFVRCWPFLATHSLGRRKKADGSGKAPGVMSCYYTVFKRLLLSETLRNSRIYALIKGGMEYKAF